MGLVFYKDHLHSTTMGLVFYKDHLHSTTTQWTKHPMQQQVYQDQFQTVVLQLELPDWSWYKLTEVLGTWTGCAALGIKSALPWILWTVNHVHRLYKGAAVRLLL